MSGNRRFLEAVLWIVRTGSPWRDLPSMFGNWSTAYTRFRDWTKADVFARLFEAVSEDPDMECAMVDATVVKVHRHGQGAKGGTSDQAIGRSKVGMTTKILALTDAIGSLMCFVLLLGQRFDTVDVADLIEGVGVGALIADRDRRGDEAVISQHPRRAAPLIIDAEMYKRRHLIENFFCKQKEFKRIAIRANKTDRSFTAITKLAAAMIATRCFPTSPRA